MTGEDAKKKVGHREFLLRRGMDQRGRGQVRLRGKKHLPSGRIFAHLVWLAINKSGLGLLDDLNDLFAFVL